MAERKGYSSTMLLACVIIALLIGGVIGYVAKPEPPRLAELEQRVKDLEAQISELQAKTLPDPIKIGHLAPVTGELGPYSEGFLKGVELAVWEVNEKLGGIAGHKVEVIVEDTRTDASAAAEAAHKLIDVDKVQVIIGAYSSSCTMAAAAYAEESHVVMISPASTSPAITDAGEYIFRVVPSDAGQGAALADLAIAMGYKTAATIVINNPYGIGIEEVFKERFEAAGGDVVATVRYELGAATYKTELGTIQEKNPDVIIDVSYADDGQIIFKEAAELGIDIPWICAEGIADEKIFEAPGVGEYMATAGGKGMIGTRPLSVVSPASVRFQELWKEHYGVEYEGEIYADYAYDAAKIALMAIAYAGVYDGEAIKDALPYVGHAYKGASGDKTFDEYGDVAGDYTIWKVELVEGEYKFVPIGKWSSSMGIELKT